MLGITAKMVSPTSPREVDITPASLTGILEPITFTSGIAVILASIYDLNWEKTHISKAPYRQL